MNKALSPVDRLAASLSSVLNHVFQTHSKFAGPLVELLISV